MAGTPVGAIIRRIRLYVNDANSELYTDTDIEEAALDFMEDVITPLNSSLYSVVAEPSPSTERNYVPEIASNLKMLIAVGTSLRLLLGEGTEASRMAISMDSPSGRVNLYERANNMEKMVRHLESELEKAQSASNLFIPGVYNLDLTTFEAGRTTPAASGAVTDD